MIHTIEVVVVASFPGGLHAVDVVNDGLEVDEGSLLLGEGRDSEYAEYQDCGELHQNRLLIDLKYNSAFIIKTKGHKYRLQQGNIHHYTAFNMRVLQPSAPHKNKERLLNKDQLSLQLSSSFEAVFAKKTSLMLSPLSPIQTTSHVLRKEYSSRDRIQSIKDQIHKLRTQSPQFTELSMGQPRSKSFFLDHPTKIKRIQDAKPLQMFMKMTYKRRHRYRQNKSILPQLSISEAKRTNQRAISLMHQHITADKSNVILLKRDMRYRLQRLPQLNKSEQFSDKQPNLSLTGWNKNPQDLQDEFTP